MNRTISPPISEIERIKFVEPQLIKFDNGMPVALFRDSSQEVIKLELIIDAGIKYQTKPLVANAVIEMLREGTTKHTADQIAEAFDIYGSYLNLSVNQDFSSISLFTLSKNLEKSLELLMDILQNPIFPEDKLEIYLSRRKQDFMVSNQKVVNLSSRQFSKVLFDTHPYANLVELNDYDHVKTADLKAFFGSFYGPNRSKLLLAGHYSDSILKIIAQAFEGWQTKSLPQNAVPFVLPTYTQKQWLIEKDPTMQSGLSMGKVLMNRTHPDYHKMAVVNTIFGGYFGSRLMKNIREDKGYTYGIHSFMQSFQETGIFAIKSEVNARFTQQTIDEVYKELRLLQTNLVEMDELNKVKSYMLGQLLRQVDGAIPMSDKYLQAWQNGLNWNHFTKAIEDIKTINPDDILQLTQLYLKEESLLCVVAGKL